LHGQSWTSRHPKFEGIVGWGFEAGTGGGVAFELLDAPAAGCIAPNVSRTTAPQRNTRFIRTTPDPTG